MTYRRHQRLIPLKHFSKHIKNISVLILAFLILLPSFTLADTTPVSTFDQPTVIPINFVPEDSLLHPTEPILYFTSVAEKKVYAFNYQTREMQSLSLTLAPERMAFQNNELYVTMTYGHSYGDALQNGSIAIIDPQTFTSRTRFRWRLILIVSLSTMTVIFTFFRAQANGPAFSVMIAIPSSSSANTQVST